MKNLLAGFALTLCLTSPAVLASDDYEPGSSHFTLDTGLLSGGDKIAERQYVLGGTDSIYAGQGLFVDAGFLHDFAGSDWAFKATAGIQSGFTAGFGSDISFTRYPIELVALYDYGKQRFGGGLTYHADPKFNGNGHVPDIVFKDAVGAVLEYQYRFIGLRYTYVRYKVEGACTGRCSFNGSNLGFFFNFVF